MPISDLPDVVRQYAEFPFQPFTQTVRAYHIKVYESWCAERGRRPWPVTIESLLEIAADRGETHAYWTVYGLVQVVALEERTKRGSDLFGHPDLKKVLMGILRDRPPNPPRALPPDKIRMLFAYEPQTRAQRTIRGLLLFTYAAGMSVVEQQRLAVEMITFCDEGLMIHELSKKRPRIFVGRANDERNCPVAAAQAAIRDRTEGALWTTPRSASSDGGFRYPSITLAIARYGDVAGIPFLSNDRVRLAGMLAQSTTISAVQLAHFHGRNNTDDFARRLRIESPRLY